MTIKDLLSQRYGQNTKLTPLNSGTRKQVYIAETNEKKFIIMVNKQKSLRYQYRSFISNNIQMNLAKRGFCAPYVIDFFYLSEGQTVACHTYIEGQQIEHIDAQIAYKIGQTVAEFHLAAFYPLKIYLKQPLGYQFYHFIQISKNFFRNLRHEITDSKWHKLPKGICHYDLNLTNFIFSGNNTYLIDYDRQRYWPFADELRRFLKNKENQKYAKDFLQGYNSIRQLNKEEQEFLEKFIH